MQILAFYSSRQVPFVKSALISNNMNIGTSVVVRHGVSSQWKNITRDSETSNSTNTLFFFMNLENIPTVLCALQYKQITSSRLSQYFLVRRWHYNSYSILTEVLPIRPWSTGSSGNGMMYSMRSIDCVDWLHHITIR